MTHDAPVYGTLLRPMLFFFLHKCWQWLIDGKKRKTCKHFLSSWSTEQTQLIQTLCLILSPSCLRFYVFKSSYESLFGRLGRVSLFKSLLGFISNVYLSIWGHFLKGFNVRITRPNGAPATVGTVTGLYLWFPKPVVRSFSSHCLTMEQFRACTSQL